MGQVTRILPALAIGTFLGLAQSPSGSFAPQGVPADLWIDAVALGRDGVPVMNLEAHELEVWIGGYRIPLLDVVAVTPEVRGRTVVLLLDDGAIGPALALRVKETAREFVALMGPADRLAVVSLHGGVMAVTDDRARLSGAIDAYHVRGLPFRLEDAGQHVLATVAALARQLAEGPAGRKAVVAIGAGWMFDTPLPPQGIRNLRPEWVDAVRAAASANTSLYVVDPAGLGVASAGHSGSSGFASETGGHAFLNTNDLRGAAARIWREAGSYYLLGVANPDIQRTAELRELDVKVLRSGVTVRARRGIPGR